MLRAMTIHWGWITPGVPHCNRVLQIGRYVPFLDREAANNGRDCFNFTHPGWLLDVDMSPDVLAVTANSPEKGKQGRPLSPEELACFRREVENGRLTFLAYPYSGAVVEGMTGESVLRSLRLARSIAHASLGCDVTGFFVHDGPFQLDWNSPMVPQIGWLAGYRELHGRFFACIVSPDGTRLPMVGQPEAGIDLLFTGTEAPDAERHTEELRQAHPGIRLLPAAEFARLLGSAPREVSACEPRTKGWYGGAPLVMQMQAALRRTDASLTALEMAAVALGRPIDVSDDWKKSLILQDCHLQWLLADVGRYYLPLSRDLERAVATRLATLVPPPTGSAEAVMNPLPFTRSVVVPDGDAFRLARNVPPLATAPLLVQTRGTRVHATPQTLVNNRIRVDLGPTGEVIRVRALRGQTLYQGRANRIRRFHAVPVNGAFRFQMGRPWEYGHWSGGVKLTTEIDVPEAGTYDFFFDTPRGLTVAFGREGDDWVPATNKHWGGGLPSGNQEHGFSGTGALKLVAGRNRLCLHAVADEGLALRAAFLKRGETHFCLGHWTGQRLFEWVEDAFEIEHVDTCNRGARAIVRFRGRFASCAAELAVSLDADATGVDVEFRRDYAERVHEGFPTLPLPPEIGSYLGSYCERPYAPAFSVEHAMPLRQTRYFSDKPYGFAEAVDSDTAWFTARFREIVQGLAPFLGTSAGFAESATGSLLMVTDGHGHFFRRRSRSDGAEQFGLSLGSSIIHPMTQCYKMKPGSYWDKIGRHMGTDYDDANDTCAFVPPLGTIACAWRLHFTAQPTLDRAFCWQQVQDFQVPAIPCANSRATRGFDLHGRGVVVTGINRNDAGIRIRLLNLETQPRRFRLRLPQPLVQAEVSEEMPMPELRVTDGSLAGILPPCALREIRIQEKCINHCQGRTL